MSVGQLGVDVVDLDGRVDAVCLLSIITSC
jgi:hypothetical protein